MGNHRPVLRNVDEAMRRRLLLIPFTAEIPTDERDPDLAEKLGPSGPAILRWMIEGAWSGRPAGCARPPCVQAATDDYFETADAFGRWADDCLVSGPNATMTRAAAFASWKAWAEAAGEYVGNERRLRDYLCASRGWTRPGWARTGRGRGLDSGSGVEGA